MTETEKEYQVSNIIFLIQKVYEDLLEMEEKCSTKEELKKARKNLLKILFYFLSIIDLNDFK